MNDWHQTKFKLPEQGKIVLTKIKDEKSERNEQKLIFKRNLWWYIDYSMYVYYTPTHWKETPL